MNLRLASVAPRASPNRVGFLREGGSVRLFAIDDGLGAAVEIKGVKSFAVQSELGGLTTVTIEMVVDRETFVQLDSLP